MERYQIRSFLKSGYTQKAIAQELGRNPGTISRELGRNTGLRGYRPQQAQRLASKRKQRNHRDNVATGRVAAQRGMESRAGQWLASQFRYAVG